MSQTPTNPLFVLIALATGGFAIGTTEFATMSLLPFIQASLDIDPSTASHIISAYALGVVFGAPVITVLGARMARKPLLLILMLLFAAGNALSALAPSYGWLVCFRFLSGLPHGAYFGLASLVAADVVAPARRTQAVGYVMLGLTAATIVGVPLATWLGGLRLAARLLGHRRLSLAAARFCYWDRTTGCGPVSPLRELGALARLAVHRRWRPVRSASAACSLSTPISPLRSTRSPVSASAGCRSCSRSSASA